MSPPSDRGAGSNRRNSSTYDGTSARRGDRNGRSRSRSRSRSNDRKRGDDRQNRRQRDNGDRERERGRQRSRDRDRDRDRSQDRDKDRDRGRRYDDDKRRTREREDSRERSRHSDHSNGDRPHASNRANPTDRRESEQNTNKQPAKSATYSSVSEMPWGNPALEIPDQAASDGSEPPPPTTQPNFGLSGALAKDTATGNLKNGVLLKCSEPTDAALPDSRRPWRVYVFKGEEVVDTLHLRADNRQSCFFFGRDERVCDVVLAHPSCSKQHAVIQFRSVRASGSALDGSNQTGMVTRPYLMDLGSANKTFLNGKEIGDAQYVEMRSKDVVRFAGSSREYVLLQDERK